jgi:hypothetical protein
VVSKVPKTKQFEGYRHRCLNTLRDRVCGLESFGSGQRGISDCFGHGNERLRSIKKKLGENLLEKCMCVSL